MLIYRHGHLGLGLETVEVLQRHVGHQTDLGRGDVGVGGLRVGVGHARLADHLAVEGPIEAIVVVRAERRRGLVERGTTEGR